MPFYEEWIENKNTETEKRFIEYFLKLVPESTEVFHKGDDAEKSAYELRKCEVIKGDGERSRVYKMF